MKKIIIDSLSNPENAGQIERVLDTFALKTTEESGLAVEDLDHIIDSVRNCMEQFEYQIPIVKYNSHLAISKLGKIKRKQRNFDTGKSDQTIARHMAQILTAYDEDITFCIASQEKKEGMRKTQFILSSEASDEEPMVSMIRSVYGTVEVQQVSDIPEFGINMFAGGEVAFKSKSTEKKEKECDLHESWVTAILTACPKKGNFTVKVRFTPIQDQIKVKDQLKVLNRLYRKLRLHADLNWSNNINWGHSLNEGQNVIGSTIGMNTNGYSSAFSMNLGSRDIHKEALIMVEYLEFEIQRLTQALKGSMWAIQISVSADDIDTIQTLTTVLSGTFNEANIQLWWGSETQEASLVALSKEVLPVMMFPTKEFAGFSFVENEEFALMSREEAEDTFKIGDILWNGAKFNSYHISNEDLCRHAFVCGMTGSGKTNTVFKIIEKIDVPFCIIEPIKGEYRALRNVYPDLDVWTMKVTENNDGNIRIMRINPFWFPNGGNLAFHIDSLKTIIASAFELTAAMPNILEQCLYSIYIKFGWDLVTNQNIYWGKVPEEYLYPTFSDLCTEVEAYLDSSEFSSELQGDYKGALSSRLKSFVNGYKGILLNTNCHPDYERILKQRSIIELDGLADDSDKCLVMGTVLTQFYQYLKLHFRDSLSSSKLSHILVIEEAHRLFKKNKGNKPGNGGVDPNGLLVELLSNMMAEIRAFGEGMIIVDQSPNKIAEDVINNSATKIVHRIDNSNDIKIMQSPMLLPDDILSFASLKQGEALIRTDGMVKPSKIKVDCSNVKEEYDLAGSFRIADIFETPLTDFFAATSILSDGQAFEIIKEKLIKFLNCLVLLKMDKWYELVGELLCDILEVLKERRKFDLVDYKLTVLFEIISCSIKRVFRDESACALGKIHMFVMRLLGFFQEKRDGRYVKRKAISMLQQYMEANIERTIISIQLENSEIKDYSRFCEILQLNPEDVFSVALNLYVESIIPAVVNNKKRMDSDVLLCSFLNNHISFYAQEYIVEKYSEVFAKLADYLNHLGNKEEDREC